MTYPDPSDLVDQAYRSLMLQRAAFNARIDAALEYLDQVDGELDEGSLASARMLALAAATCEDDATGDKRACQPLVDALAPDDEPSRLELESRGLLE